MRKLTKYNQAQMKTITNTATPIFYPKIKQQYRINKAADPNKIKGKKINDIANLQAKARKSVGANIGEGLAIIAAQIKPLLIAAQTTQAQARIVYTADQFKQIIESYKNPITATFAYAYRVLRDALTMYGIIEHSNSTILYRFDKKFRLSKTDYTFIWGEKLQQFVLAFAPD